MVGPNCFLSGPTTIQSLQNGEKMRKSELDKIVILHPMANFLSFCTFDFPLSFFFFLSGKKFLLVCTVRSLWFGLVLVFFFFF